jgi:hypothetical protein
MGMRLVVIILRMKLDTQQVEIVGRNLLISLFTADGIEIAEPTRDRGIDLIAYLDISEEDKFKAVPIQLKASSESSFSVSKKYEKFPDLLMAYVWYAARPMEATLYIMKYTRAVEIADKLGWTKTESWLKDNGAYSVQKPGNKIKDILSEHEYQPGMLYKLVNEH